MASVSGGFVGGMLGGWAIGFVALALFFARAWMLRREESEYLIFSFQTASLAVYAAGLSWVQVVLGGPSWQARWGAPADVATAGAVMSIAFGVNFALRFARFRHESWVTIPTYVLAAFYVGALVFGAWWQGPPTSLIEISTPFGAVFHAPTRPTAIAKSFYALAVLGLVGLNAIVATALFQGKREVVSTLLGSLVLSVCAINDATVGADLRHGPFLSPFGYLVFAFGVSLTLVTRYGRLSRELERKGVDLRVKSEELRASYEALKQTQAELVRKEQLAVVGELAAVIAHEVRNPLAIIGNCVAGLRKQALSADDRVTLLKIMDEETSRLNRLVSDLLCYARPVSPQRQLISLRDSVERTLSLPLVSDAQGVKVELTCESQTPPVWGDPSLLRQVFDNIIGNAVQAMHGEGTLNVRLAPGDLDGVRGVVVEIQDTGEGMDTQVRTRARTPFFTTRPSGTGLGLAIVDRIIDAHGGTMTMQSKAGEGTTVSVFLPQGRESQPPEPRAHANDPDAAEAGFP